jgi:PAS domain S-box-containing protein
MDESKPAGDLLEESAEDLYERAPVGYLSWLVDGTIVKANRTLLDWTSLAHEYVVGEMRLHDLLAPGSRIYYETHVAPLLQMQGEVREIAAELLRADGRRLPVLMNAVLVRDAADTPQIVRATLFDASERRRYERELLRARADAEARARAALALEHVAEGVLLVGEDGRIELLNPAAEAVLGRRAADVVGRPASQALVGWDDVSARVTVARRGEVPAPEVLPLGHGDDERWLSVAAVDAGDAVAYTFRDVTAERVLDRLRTEMVAVVSHELRTPLTGAYGAARTLLDRHGELTGDQRHTLLELMVEQTQRLTKILDQILLTSALDTATLNPELAAFDAHEVVDAVLQSVAADDRGRIIVAAPKRIRVKGDLDRLRQVIGNLVDNALKYSDGPVRIRVCERDLSARFTVADEGPGIPADDRERIFEKFFRLDPAQRSGIGGTGLGLYIARELAQRMGGRIGYLPREHGAAFYVEVRLAA